MKPLTKNYLLLIVSTLISLIPFWFIKEIRDIDEHIFKVLLLCVSYSLFLIHISNKRISIIQKTLVFLALNLLWILSFFLSLPSYGFLVPVFGAFSPPLISKFIFSSSSTNYLLKLLLFGFLASTIGLILFYITINTAEHYGFGFAIIITLWQFTTGILLLENKQPS